MEVTVQVPRLFLILVVVCLSPLVSLATDWNRFRGPNGSGVSEDTTPTPSEWSETKNLKWKVALPGAGVSCPIVVGEKLFVTCYSGYGESREKMGDMKDLVRHLLCFDKSTGKELWRKSVPSTVQEDTYSGRGVPQHGYASHTPVSDGKRVYVFFGKSGVLAFDLDGKQLWQTSVGTDSDPMSWGSSSSPILHTVGVIVPAGAESRAIVCLDKDTGKELWRSKADSLGMVWGTPAVVESEGKSEIVIGAPYEVWGLNPANGKLRWFCPATEDDQYSSSVVVVGNTIYAVGGRGGGSVAVKAGGKDDVSGSHVVWKGRDSVRFATPLVHDGKMFIVADGTVACLDATTGKEIFKSRLSSGPGAAGGAANSGPGSGGGGGFGGGGRRGGGMGGGDYASPIIADGKVYHLTRRGDMHVFAVANEFKPIAVNRVTSESEDFSATPAVSDGAIFIRSNKHLYCVAQQ